MPRIRSCSRIVERSEPVKDKVSLLTKWRSSGEVRRRGDRHVNWPSRLPSRLPNRLRRAKSVRRRQPWTATPDHDDLGLNQSKIIVIDSNKLERDAGGKPVPTFPHRALSFKIRCGIGLPQFYRASTADMRNGPFNGSGAQLRTGSFVFG
jgi:hypothetical protein